MKRHVRHVSGGALHGGGREPGGWWCAGAHVAGGASAVLPADSAEQAGTNSPRLMCLLCGINSHSPGCERGRVAASPITPGTVIFFFFFFSESPHRLWSQEETASGWACVTWVSFLNFTLSGAPPFGWQVARLPKPQWIELPHPTWQVFLALIPCSPGATQVNASRSAEPLFLGVPSLLCSCILGHL